MTGNPVGLVEFLLARLSQLEEAANWASTTPAEPEWKLLNQATVQYGKGLAVQASERAMAHVALNDPAYVLQDIAAKRRIIHEFQQADFATHPDWEGGYASGLEQAVRLLAAPFSSHPDWQPEWSTE